MTLLSPERLILLLGVLALAVIYAVLQYRRRQYVVRFTNMELLDQVAPRRPAWRRHVVAAGFLVLVSLLVVAYAEPAREVDVPRERATIVLAIDTSLSMMADDVDPARIDAAKSAAVEFLADVPEQVNVGLVSFNGTATVRVAPTTDRALVSDAVENLELGEATAIGDALFASLEALAQGPPLVDADGEPAPGAIVLMSDGETTVGRPNVDGILEAQSQGVAVSTIAFGTSGGIIEVPGEAFPVPVPVREDDLRQIASETGGEFFTASSAGELESVYRDIGSDIGFETETEDISGWFVGAALLVALLTGLGSLAWFQRLP
ncbi:MAG: VWA domain-containing protein [Acidimicrobiia bacterium]|nr:VWA domain-containing protein [Acidimicrobiia bacterium]